MADNDNDDDDYATYDELWEVIEKLRERIVPHPDDDELLEWHEDGRLKLVAVEEAEITDLKLSTLTTLDFTNDMVLAKLFSEAIRDDNEDALDVPSWRFNFNVARNNRRLFAKYIKLKQH